MYTLRSACVTVTLVFLCASRQAAVMTSRHRMGQGGEGARAGHGTGSGGPPLLSHMGRSRNGPQPLSSGSGSGWEAPPSSHHCCRMHSCYALPLCIPFSALSTFCCKSPPPSFFHVCLLSRSLFGPPCPVHHHCAPLLWLTEGFRISFVFAACFHSVILPYVFITVYWSS